MKKRGIRLSSSESDNNESDYRHFESDNLAQDVSRNQNSELIKQNTLDQLSRSIPKTISTITSHDRFIGGKL